MTHFIELTQKINTAHGKRTIFVAIENIDFFYDEHIVYSNRAIDVYESISEIKDKIDKSQAIEYLDDNCKVMGNTEIYLEDNGDDPPYNQQWIDLDTHEFVITEGFKAGDKVEILIRKK